MNLSLRFTKAFQLNQFTFSRINRLILKQTFAVLGMTRPKFALQTSLQMQHVIGVIPH